MKLKNKFKAETLSETVVSMAIFGILLLGITDFMSSQINFASNIKHKDELIFKAQSLAMEEDFLKKLREATSDIVSTDYTWSKDKKILTVKDKYSKEELFFALP